MRLFQILLILISYLPISSINLNAIRPNILSIIIFYYGVFDKEEIVTKEYLFILLITEYLLVSPVQGIIISIVYFGGYHLIKKNKNIFLNKSFLSLLFYYFLFSLMIELMYNIKSLDFDGFFLKDFIFVLLNNLIFYILFHIIFEAYKSLLNKPQLK